MDSNNVAGMPNPQNQPVNPPVEPNPVEQALAEEPAPAPVPMGAPVKKSGKGAIYGMIFFAILAIAGIGFGVYMMMENNNQKSSYESQITNLKKQNNELLDKLAGDDGGSEEGTKPELNGDIALDLLRKKAQNFGIAYANVYAKYNGTDKVAYWVKYYPTHVQNVEVMTANDIIFTLNDNGEWEFELPGFTGYGPELTEQYTVLRQE